MEELEVDEVALELRKSNRVGGLSITRGLDFRSRNFESLILPGL